MPINDIDFFILKTIGGAKGDRTPDLNAASVALSQLSYGPKNRNIILVFFFSKLLITQV